MTGKQKKSLFCLFFILLPLAFYAGCRDTTAAPDPGSVEPDFSLGDSGAPLFDITQVYRDASRFLEQGERVLVIELDGWGWEMYLRAEQPYLGGLGAEAALSVIPPFSPVALASMLTGELPEVHGIQDRTTREPLVEDLFAKTAAMGKKALYIEGNTTLIKTSLTPVLSPDRNGTNGTDDEVYGNAKKAQMEKPDFLFVHFHGVDDTAHAYGPYATETLAKIAYIDGLVADLTASWQGGIIITADHGLHETPDGGDHGDFNAEDMLVPYIIVNGDSPVAATVQPTPEVTPSLVPSPSPHTPSPGSPSPEPLLPPETQQTPSTPALSTPSTQPTVPSIPPTAPSVSPVSPAPSTPSALPTVAPPTNPPEVPNPLVIDLASGKNADCFAGLTVKSHALEVLTSDSGTSNRYYEGYDLSDVLAKLGVTSYSDIEVEAKDGMRADITAEAKSHGILLAWRGKVNGGDYVYEDPLRICPRKDKATGNEMLKQVIKIVVSI